MSRLLSLAYLTANACTPSEMIHVAARQGFQAVGLRVLPNAPGAPKQHLIGHPEEMRATLRAIRETGVTVFDLEIIRIGEGFSLGPWMPLLEAGAELGAKAALVAGDDRDLNRLADHYAKLCEAMAPYGMTADLEFMPWTAVPHARAALEVVRAAGTPTQAGILVDALHVGRSQTTLDDLRALPRGLLHYAQICDAQAGLGFTEAQLIHTARCERLLPGEGSIDIAGIFGALPGDLPVSVEIVHLERQKCCTADEWARQCREASWPHLN